MEKSQKLLAESVSTYTALGLSLTAGGILLLANLLNTALLAPKESAAAGLVKTILILLDIGIAILVAQFALCKRNKLTVGEAAKREKWVWWFVLGFFALSYGCITLNLYPI